MLQSLCTMSDLEVHCMTRFTLRRRSALLALLLGAVLSVAAGTLSTQLAAAHPRDEAAYVRVLHASPDAPPVDVLVNGKAAVTWLAFGHITSYLRLSSETSYDVKIVPASQPSTVVLDLKGVRFNEGYSTVAAIGLLNPGSTGNGFTVKVFHDQNRTSDDRSRVRVVHLSPNAPAVDVYLRRGNASFGKAVSDIAYPNNTGYLSVKPGWYTVAIAPAPSTSASSAIYRVSARLRPDTVYTAWALGTLPLAGKPNNFFVLLTADVHANSEGDD